jgi:DNA-binding NarL/FixJ family response regulator
MTSVPRIITVDPSGIIPRMIRTAADLIGRQIVLVDLGNSDAALNEIMFGGCSLLVTAVDLGGGSKGYHFAMQVRQSYPDLGIIILADLDDPNLDASEFAEASLIYLHRNTDIHKFIRAIAALFEGENILSAVADTPAPQAAPTRPNLGPVPRLDNRAADKILDGLLRDVGAMAILLVSRDGEIVNECGAAGYMDREQLIEALLPLVPTTIAMSDIVGGRASTIQFFDGEEYDVFVLSVGLHHFLCVILRGEMGNRQFGAVNRFGRRSAEDLIALLGAAAFVVERPKKTATMEVPAVRPNTAPPVEETVVLERPEIRVREPEPIKLEPIENLDLSIFDDLADLDLADADDLFAPENLAKLANEDRRKGGTASLPDAIELGIIPDFDL